MKPGTPYRTIRVRLALDELTLIEDALYYYRLSTEQGGPQDHDPVAIRRVQNWIGRYIATEEKR